MAAVVLLSIVALRLHEMVPLVGRLHPAMLIMLLGVGLAWSHSSNVVHESVFRDKVFQLTLLYIAWAGITAPFALWVGLAADTLKTLASALSVVVVLLLCEPTRRVLDRIHISLVVAVTALAVLARIFGRSTAGRLEAGASLDPNDLAAVMAMFLPFALSLVRRRRLSVKLLGVMSSATLTTVIISTSSRGGTLALAVAVLVYALGFRGSRMLIAAGLLAVGGAIAWQTAPADFRDRITSIGQEDDYNYTAFSGRKQVWARARLYIAERPIQGVGIGNFGVREGEYCREVMARGCKWSTTHNTYLQAGAELGVPGMSIFIGLLVLLAWKSRPMWRASGSEPEGAQAAHQPELMASLAAFAVAAYFLSLAYFYCLFLLAGLVALAHRVRLAEAARLDGDTLGGFQAQPYVYGAGWRSAMSGRRRYRGTPVSGVPEATNPS
ncbi:MAG: O-antigen ligase family protein [Gemmatimonadaceae bacterium]